MSHPDFDVAAIGKITSKLEDKGKQFIRFTHVKDDIFRVTTSDPAKDNKEHTADYRILNDQLIEIFVDPSGK